MGCGCSSCNSCSCSCQSCTSTCEEDTCETVCTSLNIENSWNIPACSASATLSAPGLSTVLIGSYIYNPTYGAFRITNFDSVNGQITIINECFDINEDPGTVVPAGTEFIFGMPPSSTNITYSAYSTGTNYTFNGVSSAITFGTTSPSLTVTVPGTYLVLTRLGITANAMTTAGANQMVIKLRRTNNTPADVISDQTVYTTQPIAVAFTGALTTTTLDPHFYTTLNSNDVLSLYGNLTGVTLTGSIEAINCSLVLIKLS